MSDFSAYISDAADIASEELISFLQRMVQSPSLPDNEHEGQNLIAQRLVSMGLEVDILPSNLETLRNHPAFGDDDFSPSERINVMGHWRGTQTGEGRSLILDGHVDVVSPGNLELWDGSPWSGAILAGRLFGAEGTSNRNRLRQKAGANWFGSRHLIYRSINNQMP